MPSIRTFVILGFVLALGFATPIHGANKPWHGDSFDRPVDSLQIRADGTYFAGFMYWYGRESLFMYEPEMVLFGVVSKVTPAGVTPPGEPLRTTTGRLAVKKVVVCPERLRQQAARIRWLECGGLGGLAAGDSVLVFLVHYEGQYAVPDYTTSNTDVGYKLSGNRDEPGFAKEFVALLSSGHAWDIRLLTPDELRLWAVVDPSGVAEAFIRERELSKKGVGKGDK